MNLKSNDGFEPISAMMAYWDKDLVCRFANRAYLDWFGRNREDMIDKITLLELLGPEIFKKNEPFISGALSGENQTFERELTIPSGETRIALANYYPDIDKGKVVGFFVHIADITHSKDLEKKIIESNEIIKDQNKLLINFAHLVSHNLSTYSGNISSVLNLFLSSSNSKEKDELLKYLVNVSEQFSETVKNLTEIVKFNKFESFLLKSVNLHRFTEKLKKVLYQQLEDTGGVIINKLDENLTLKLNPAYAESIILNLFTNAIKYRSTERKPVIEIWGEEFEDKVLIHVKDNGIGIDLNKNGKSLFEIHKTFHGNKDAQGVGLFITKYQIEKMNGSIKAESEIDKGTMFTITFIK